MIKKIIVYVYITILGINYAYSDTTMDDVSLSISVDTTKQQLKFNIINLSKENILIDAPFIFNKRNLKQKLSNEVIFSDKHIVDGVGISLAVADKSLEIVDYFSYQGANIHVAYPQVIKPNVKYIKETSINNLIKTLENEGLKDIQALKNKYIKIVFRTRTMNYGGEILKTIVTETNWIELKNNRLIIREH